MFTFLTGALSYFSESSNFCLLANGCYADTCLLNLGSCSPCLRCEEGLLVLELHTQFLIFVWSVLSTFSFQFLILVPCLESLFHNNNDTDYSVF